MIINNCGYDYRHDNAFSINRPYGSGDYMLLVLRSSAWFLLNGERITTNGSAVIIFEKGYKQLYGALDNEYINDWVHFDATDEEIQFLKAKGIRFNEIIELHTVSHLTDIIRNMCREKYSDNVNSENSALLYFDLFFNKLHDLTNINEKYDKPSLFEKISKIRREIYNNPQDNRTVKEMADSIYISISYFQHSYKEFFGVGVKQDITNARIEHAKHLLFSTDYSIANVSKMCGYENDVHFMRQFKRYVGVTPTGYRLNSIISEQKVEASYQAMPFKKSIQ